MRFGSLFLLLFLGACTPTVYKLKGNYGNGNFEQATTKGKEQVWSNLIDFFAKNGLSIKIIDKSSGLITSEPTRLKWSIEDDKGNLYDPNAWVAVAKMKGMNGQVVSTAFRVVAEWNVRVKDGPNGSTLVGVNLVNAQYMTGPAGSPYTLYTPGSIHSTGVFENTIFNAIK
ncbi:MAG: hypothetical protein EOP56_19645 [Sphingobacteriales bacterium]|nr:MAG: hypothetical protein EOP56_19645 [Sphingobacteriales bacterium]